MTAADIRKRLAETIENLSKVAWLFLRNPSKDFTRKRKLSFQDTVSFLLAMEGKSTTNELLDYFRCSVNAPTSSALRQQRDKILPEAFEFLFWEFVDACADKHALYNGYRLLAVDGSDLSIATNPSDPDSYFPGCNGQKPYNILHLNALYDLRQKVYVDAVIQKRKSVNEFKALCQMVDRSNIPNALLLADRGYESYNALAHIQEKKWKFLFRVKDGKHGIISGLALPDAEEFDCPIHLSLTRKQSNEVKELRKQNPCLRYIAHSSPFDFLPAHTRKYDPFVSYTLHFRVVRFKLTDTSYETVLTNLDPVAFPPQKLKDLYAMRWGIETSFRDLKYTVGLASFHSKKVEHIFQEIFARLIMYNFSELVTASVVIQKKNRKYAYQANFSAAVHICRQFFRGNVHPPNLEALLARFISPVRPDRKQARKLTRRGVVSFVYRVA